MLLLKVIVPQKLANYDLKDTAKHLQGSILEGWIYHEKAHG